MRTPSVIHKDKDRFDSNRTLDSCKRIDGKLVLLLEARSGRAARLQRRRRPAGALAAAWSAHTFIMWANVPGTTWRAEGRPTRPNTSAAVAHPCRLALCRHPLATTTQRVFDHQHIDENGANMPPSPPGGCERHRGPIYTWGVLSPNSRWRCDR